MTPEGNSQTQDGIGRKISAFVGTPNDFLPSDVMMRGGSEFSYVWYSLFVG